MKRSNRIGPVIVTVFLSFAFPPHGPAETEVDYSTLRGEGLGEVLKPIPARSPREALDTLEVLEGLRVELAAHEPLVLDPVAACIDENGALYVCELADYPYRPEEGDPPLGRVRLLIDRDNDGFYETSTVFADRLLWPAGVAPWNGGVYITAPPDIWYMKDTDGDGAADLREKAFTGFGEYGAQYILNNLKWGPDHRLYVSVAGNGGEVVPVDNPDAKPISVRGVDFRFDPVTRIGEATSGGEQFGNTFDDWGNRFLCSQDTFLHQVVYPLRYLERNPLLSVPDTQARLVQAGDPIFRTSPVEAWRAIRSSRRILSGKGRPERSGVSHHVSDGVAGTTVYTGGALPPSFYGNSFSGDAQNNLVHRRSLERAGVLFRSERLDPGTEFLRTDDNWFRPVNFLTAPDGSLYVFDLCREILEAVHIPMDVVKHLDLTSGRDRGRIYRIVREGWQRPSPPHLGQASTIELAALLEHPNGWWRETAHRLLFERQDATVEPQLRTLLAGSKLPQARFLALYSLHGLGRLTAGDVLLGLRDDHPAIREHSVLLGESFLSEDGDLREALLALVEDADARVHFQLAHTLGEFPGSGEAAKGLADLSIRSGDDPFLRTAILGSAYENAEEILGLLLSDRKFTGRPEMAPLVQELARFAGFRNPPAEIASLIDARLDFETPDAFLLGLNRGLESAGAAFSELEPMLSETSREVLSGRIRKGIDSLRNPTGELSEKERAIRLLALGVFEEAWETLSSLLDGVPPEALQSAAIETLFGMKRTEAIAHLLDRWKGLSPGARRTLLGRLLQREDAIRLLLDRIEKGSIALPELDASSRSGLLNHPSPEVGARAKSLFESSVGDSRIEAIDAFRPALEMEGDFEEGGEIFELLCSSCHLLNGVGKELGPNLALPSSRSREELLLHIVDPNREVDPRFIQYHAQTHDGELISGILVSETAASVTLRSQDEEKTLSRVEIESLRSSGLSIMPEGLEEGLDPEQMAGLLRFLMESQYDLGTSGQSFPTDQPETD